MKQVLPQKYMHLPVLKKFGPAPLKMLHLIPAHVLKLFGQTFLYSTTVYLIHKGTGCAQVANVPFQIARHEPQRVLG